MPSPYGSAGSYEATLQLLERTQAEVLTCFAVTPEQLGRSYAPGKWTMRELLVHMADSESAMLDRLRRIIADDKPLLLAYDENHWAGRLAYGQRDVAAAGRLFAASREAILELARLCAHAHGRSGVHSERGTVTFLEQLDTIAGHSAHHLGQLRAIREGRVWTRPAQA